MNFEKSKLQDIEANLKILEKNDFLAEIHHLLLDPLWSMERHKGFLKLLIRQQKERIKLTERHQKEQIKFIKTVK